jgi:hypothetical protein
VLQNPFREVTPSNAFSPKSLTSCEARGEKDSAPSYGVRSFMIWKLSLLLVAS